MKLEPEFVDPATTVGEALVAELLAENAKARRMLRKDHLGNESDRWAAQHAHLNFLLHLILED